MKSIRNELIQKFKHFNFFDYEFTQGFERNFILSHSIESLCIETTYLNIILNRIDNSDLIRPHFYEILKSKDILESLSFISHSKKDRKESIINLLKVLFRNRLMKFDNSFIDGIRFEIEDKEAYINQIAGILQCYQFSNYEYLEITFPFNERQLSEIKELFLERDKIILNQKEYLLDFHLFQWMEKDLIKTGKLKEWYEYEDEILGSDERYFKIINKLLISKIYQSNQKSENIEVYFYKNNNSLNWTKICEVLSTDLSKTYIVPANICTTYTYTQLYLKVFDKGFKERFKKFTESKEKVKI